MKIITAMNNPELNEELKKEKNIEIICKDIFYKEGILEILENEINLDYIFINYELPGEIKLNNLIEKIMEKNEKIKIIILIKKESKNNLYKIKKEKITKNNLEIIKDIKNKNIIRIFYNEKLNLIELKNYNKNNDEKIENIEIKNKENKKIIFMGENQVGKSMTITMLTKNLENKNKKVLIIEMNKKEHDLLFLFGKNNKLIHKKIKLKNKYKIKNNNYYNKKNNLNIIKKLIIKLNKNTDYLFNNKLINFKKIKKLEKYYNYIFIEINLNNKNIKNKKIINNINKKILIINPNLINIKNTLNKIEKNKINKFKVIINNYNNYSIDEKVIKNIFKGNKVIGKINYKKEYDSLINNNFKIPENNLKNIMKDFNYIEI
ncbi:MAG: hypothetical protein V8S10_07880 [Clostridia bacterium]